MEDIRLFPFVVQETDITQDIPWNLKQINVQSYWKHSKGDKTVVAVIDTGLDIDHPEIKDRVINPHNFTQVGNEENVKDENGHGTHVAGIIAGKTTGVAPEARIMPLKVFGDNKVNTNIRNAFKYLMEWNEKVDKNDRVVAVNCSFGSSVYDPVMAYLIRSLTSQGVAVIVAAGNSGDGNPETQEIFSYPAYIWEVITTAATNQDGKNAGYSNSFDGIDLSAPGTDVYSAWPGGKYKRLSGTSMATPHVTGAYALIADVYKKRAGYLPDSSTGEKILFNHIANIKVNTDPQKNRWLIGRGLLDLTYSNSRWPLYRVQIGSYYYKNGADMTEKKAKKAGFDTTIVKY